MFGAIFDGGEELLGKCGVFDWSFTAGHSASDRMGDNTAIVGFGEEFRGGAHKLKGRAVDVEEVGRGVEGAKLAVNIERVERGGA